MKEFIGFVTMYWYDTCNHGVKVQLDRPCRDAINSKEIVFKPKKLKIFIPTIDDYKRYSLSVKGGFSFGVRDTPNEEFVGKYKMYKIEEYFVLKIIKEK